MVQISKRLKVKCIAEGSYFPVEITKGEWYHVVGIVARDYTIVKGDKQETRTMIKFLVLNDKMKLQQIAADNCEVLNIEEKDSESQ